MFVVKVDTFAKVNERLIFLLSIIKLIGHKNNQHQSKESCCLKMFGHMVKFMLYFLDAEIQTTYMYGRNNHNLKHIICPNKKTYAKNVVYNEVIKDITSE